MGVEYNWLCYLVVHPSDIVCLHCWFCCQKDPALWVSMFDDDEGENITNEWIERDLLCSFVVH